MTPSSFTIGCCSLALRTLPIIEAADKIADAGFSAIEIFYHQIKDLDEPALRNLRQHCVDRKLQVTAIAPYFSFTSTREAWLDSLKSSSLNQCNQPVSCGAVTFVHVEAPSRFS